MSDEFLPSGYEVPPTPNNYMKLEEGKNSFRVLSSAITGYIYFVDKKPVRVKSYDAVPDAVKQEKDSRLKAKHFWAFVVFNRKAKQVQIIEIKQRTVMNGITTLVNNPKWGNPKKYDIVVSKTKTGATEKDVEYSVIPEPPIGAVEPAILKLYQDMHVDLNALYEGKDPFNSEAPAPSHADAPDEADF